MSAPDSTLLAEVLRHALDGIAIVEGAASSPRVVYANATLAALLRRAEDWTIGRSLDEVESEAPADPNVTSVGVGLRVRLRRADGTSIECERWALVLPDARLALHYRPLSRAAGTLAAAVDRSSGLCTPEHLMEVLRRDWSIAQRDGGTLTLMQFDVDDTAEYREVFGRGATENVLRQVGRAIATSMRRTSDVIAHLADDEFGVLGVNMEADRAAHHAEHIASRIRALAIHHPRSRAGRYLSLSGGVVTVAPPRTLRCEALVAAVQQALVEAKRLGGNRVVVHTIDNAAEVEASPQSGSLLDTEAGAADPVSSLVESEDNAADPRPGQESAHFPS
jgi:diguanylate cyclase (GGDEF)-like protein